MSRRQTITCDKCGTSTMSNGVPEAATLESLTKAGWDINTPGTGDLCPPCKESVEIACEWSDYRKAYGVSAEAMTEAHKAFQAGWAAARGQSHEEGPLR